MNKKKCFVLDIKRFQESGYIIKLLTEQNEIKSTLLKGYGKKNQQSLQIGDKIDCNFFGRDNSLGFITYETIDPFGRMFNLNRLDFSILYSSCKIINTLYEKNNSLYFDLFQVLLNTFNNIKKSNDIKIKIIEYLNLEIETINQSGWFNLENNKNTENTKEKLTNNYKAILEFKRKNNHKNDIIFYNSRKYILNAL